MYKEMVKYIHEETVHNTRAAEIVVPIIMDILNPRSVLDIGCGIGTWLKVFCYNSIEDYMGVDGDYTDRKKIHIPINRFISHDLTQPLNLNKQYDLVLSLEVAEHLPESAADQFIKTLTDHSKIVLFSAAIPGQGGQNHLNEQWPAYWQDKFSKHGYRYYDLIRPKVWDDENVDIWYRQNMFLVCHKNIDIQAEEYSGVNLVHPEFWKKKIDKERLLSEQIKNWREGDVGVVNSSKSLGKSLKKFLHI